MTDSISPRELKVAKQFGWIKAVTVAGVAAIVQLVQILRADADTVKANAVTYDRIVSLENKIDLLTYETRHLSERVTVLERPR